MTDQTAKETSEVRTAGRELDALVAEKVMGWQWEHVPEDEYSILRVAGTNWCAAEINRGEIRYGMLPNFSTEAAAAMELLKTVVVPFRRAEIRVTGGLAYDMEIYEWAPGSPEQCVAEVSTADSLPLAICLAALQVVEVSHG